MFVLSISRDKVDFFIDDEGLVRVVWFFGLLVAEEEFSLANIWNTYTCSDGSLENYLALGPASTSSSYGWKQPTKSIFSPDIFKLSKF